MHRDVDEPGLYPPDAEDDELTGEAKHQRKRAAIGTALLVWGMTLLVERAFRINLDTFVLGIGLAALVGWTQVRRYNWFVVGAIGTGLGAADVSGALLHNAFGSAVGSLLIAAGFAAIYVRYPRRSMWALVPAGIMALIGAGAFGVGLIGLLPAVFGRFLLPLLLVGGGALLLFRHSLPPKTVKIGLAALAATFVIVGATSVPEIDHRSPVQLGNVGNGFSTPQPLNLVSGQTLVLAGGGSGDIEFRRSDVATIQIAGDSHRPSEADVRPNGDQVVVGGGDNVDYIVSLPAGSKVDVTRGSGDVKGELAAVTGSIRTDSGGVDLKLDAGGEFVEGAAGLDIRSDSGDVTIDSDVPLYLALRSDGDVELNGENQHGRYRSPDSVRAVEVDVRTSSGDIVVDLPRGAGAGSPTTPSVPPPPGN